MTLTEAQKGTLARFVFAASLVGLVYEVHASHFAIGRLTLDELLVLRNYRLPVSDAVYGFAPFTAERAVWWAASLIGVVLVVGLALLLPHRGKAARSALAVLGGLYALTGFDVLPRLAAGTLWAMDGGKASVPRQPWSIVDAVVASMPVFDGGVLGAVEEAFRAVGEAIPFIGQVLTCLAVAALLYATWKPERRLPAIA